MLWFWLRERAGWGPETKGKKIKIRKFLRFLLSFWSFFPIFRTERENLAGFSPVFVIVCSKVQG